MKVTDFVLKVDEQRKRYFQNVAQQETNKNNKKNRKKKKPNRWSEANIGDVQSARIYEIPGNDLWSLLYFIKKHWCYCHGQCWFFKDIPTTFFHAITENENCPVSSFKKYLKKLNPQCQCFWQGPKHHVTHTADVWYSRIGPKSVWNFMKEIPTKAWLSTMYTYHSSFFFEIIKDANN